MRALGLITRGGIGKEMFAAINTEPVARSGASRGRAGKISVLFPIERVKGARLIFPRAFFQDHIDRLRLRRPDAEVRLVCSNNFRSDRVTTLHRTLPVFPARARNLVLDPCD